MYRRKLIFLLLLAGVAGAKEGLPLISNEARHCAKPQVCLSLSVMSLDSPDKALNSYADGLLNLAFDDISPYNFKSLNQAGLESWLQHAAKELELDKDDPLDTDYSYGYELSQAGESAHYRVLDLDTSACLGGAHCGGNANYFVLPKTGELRVLALDDILLPNQRGRLDELLKAAAARYMQGDEPGEPITLGADDKWRWASDDWRLDREGLIFRYGTGQLDGYAGGLPELLLTKEQLRDIVKPEILAECDSWQSQEPGPITPKPQWRD